MSPPSVMFTAPVTTATYMDPSAVHLLIARETPAPTTVRNPFIADWNSKSKTVSSFMADLQILNATVDGTVTSWTAIKHSNIGLDSTLLVTDRATQLDWQVKQSYTDKHDKTELWDETNKCAVKTSASSTSMDCQKTMLHTVMETGLTYTKTTTISEHMDGPSLIVLPGKAVATVTTTSGNSTTAATTSGSSATTATTTGSSSTSSSLTTSTTAAAAAKPSATTKSAAASSRSSLASGTFGAWSTVVCSVVVALALSAYA